MKTARGVWDGVLRRLDSEVPAFALDAWLRPLEAEMADEGLRLLAPSTFHRERVRRAYLALIRECAAKELGRCCPVTLDVGGGAPRVQEQAAPTPAGPEKRPAAPRRPAQPPLPYTFASFVVGPANALAREASLALARGRALGVSPLYLVAAPGNGKSHLATALAEEARRRRDVRVRHLSAEGFTTQLLSSIRQRQTAGFKRRFRQDCDLLVFEDVQFLTGKKSTQLELFHTIEHLRRVGAGVAFTGDRLPRDIPDLEARLSSQLTSGLVAEIEPPDAALRRDILRGKAAAGGVRVPPECIERLVDCAHGSVRDLEGVLIQLVTSAALLKRPIDLELTELALRKLVPRPARGHRLTAREVIETVASFHGITREMLASRSRKRDVLVPRQLAMYLCRRYTDASLPEIGRALGREHPAVRHAIEVVERAMLQRAPLRYRVEELSQRLDALSGRAPEAGS